MQNASSREADKGQSTSVLDSNKNTVLVRVDANRQIGIGHAMRCLAVAEYLVGQKCAVYFAMRTVSDQLRPRIEGANIRIISLSEKQCSPQGLLDVAISINASFLMLDGYHLDYELERTFQDHCVKTLRFDDYMPGSRCYADIVVNASPHAEFETYKRWAPDAAILLGPRFIAFRSDMVNGFMASREKVDVDSYAAERNSILVNFGGSDPLDMTVATVTALSKALPGVTIEAVTGAAYPNSERLSRLSIKKFRHHHNSGNLANIIQRARIAVSAGGLTVQELALFRVPTILAITAPNQIKGAHVSWCKTLRPDWQSQDENTDKIIGDIARESKILWQSAEERTKIIERIPSELDIHGAQRIANALIKESKHDQ